MSDPVKTYEELMEGAKLAIGRAHHYHEQPGRQNDARDYEMELALVLAVMAVAERLDKLQSMSGWGSPT